MSRQVKFVVTATVTADADDEAVAEAILTHLADSDDEQTPGVESVDNIEWERVE